jgi:hypothetical protein
MFTPQQEVIMGDEAKIVHATDKETLKQYIRYCWGGPGGGQNDTITVPVDRATLWELGAALAELFVEEDQRAQQAGLN